MKLFKDNLRDYEKIMGLSSADIAELAELPLSEIENMEEGHFILDTVRIFCSKLSIDYSSIYADSGFKSISIEKQYDEYPQELKMMVTKEFSKWLKKTLIKKEVDLSIIPFYHTLWARFVNGTAAMDLGHLNDLKKSLEEVLTADEVIDSFANIMFSKIPNYNYMVAKTHYDLSYEDIANLVGLHKSTPANWGGKYCHIIPDQYIPTLAESLGGINEYKFRTVPLKEKDFMHHVCNIVSVKKKGGRRKSTDIELLDPPQDEVPASLVVPPVKKVDISAPSAVTIDMTTDRMMKMYSALNDSDKAKVNQLITELFIDAM